jgi:hypothetical protein
MDGGIAPTYFLCWRQCGLTVSPPFKYSWMLKEIMQQGVQYALVVPRRSFQGHANPSVYLHVWNRCRRLQSEELAKAKGTPSEWNSKPAKKIPTKSALFCTSLHLWVAVGDSLADWWNLLDGSTKKAQVTLLEPEMADTSGQDEFVAWNLPDLVVGGNWHQARQHSLKMLAAEFPDTDQLIADGEQALDIHQQNYTDAGPQHLELLWCQNIGKLCSSDPA